VLHWDELEGRSESQPNAECAAFARLAGHTDLPTVLLGDPFDNGEPQARTPAPPGAGLIDSIETLKDVRQMCT
jgi:hypothetical protein